MIVITMVHFETPFGLVSARDAELAMAIVDMLSEVSVLSLDEMLASDPVPSLHN